MGAIRAHVAVVIEWPALKGPVCPILQKVGLIIYSFLSTAEGQRCCQGNLYFGSREKYFIVSYGTLIQ